MFSSLKQELQPNQLLSSAIAGLAIGLINILTDIAPMALFVFSGDLSQFFAPGLGLLLLSAAIVGGVTALLSSFVGIISFPVVEEMVVLAAIAHTIQKSLPADLPDAQLWLTLSAAIVLTSLFTGAVLLTLGQLKLGEIIRFLPYPVVAGFLAGIGYLLSWGAIQVMTGQHPTLFQLPSLFQFEMLLRWLPGLGFAVLLLLITRRLTHFLVIPTCFLAATGLFHLVRLLTHTPLAQVFQTGWLLGPFPAGHLWQPLQLSSLWQADWSLVFAQSNHILTMAILTSLSVLLVASGLEVVTGQEANLNQELRATGIANILSGLVGGTVGSQAMGTLLVQEMGVKTRLVGVFAALFQFGVLLFGITLLSVFPKLVMGGMLLFLGLSLLLQTLYETWFKLPKLDYLIIVLITLVVAVSGLVQGVAVGLAVAVILFAINYSQIGAARFTFSGATHSSHRVRSPNQERLLRDRGGQIYGLELQGYIFFGTANKLYNQIRQRFGSSQPTPPRFVVLNFRQVSGLDSSAIQSFGKLKQLATKHSSYLVLTHLSPMLETQLRQDGVLDQQGTTDQAEASRCQVFPDLDRGLEWCEAQILQDSQFRRLRSLPLAIQLKNLFTDTHEHVTAEQVSVFIDCLEANQLQVGDYLFRQGDQPDALYFVDTGELSTVVNEGEFKTRRVQTLASGTVVGEIAFHTHQPYETAAIAEQPTKLYRLSRDRWQQLQQEHPDVAMIFSAFLNSLLANRLADAQTEIANLIR